MMIAENIAFAILAAAIVISAIRVVTTSNVVHAALYLTVVLAGVAGLYILTAAEFAASVQILVYIGAIVVLFLFGVMLTRATVGKSGDLNADHRWPALVVALLFMGLLTSVFRTAFSGEKIYLQAVGTTDKVADAIFGQYLMPFEILSLLLLAALVGAVVLARRD